MNSEDFHFRLVGLLSRSSCHIRTVSDCTMMSGNSMKKSFVRFLCCVDQKSDLSAPKRSKLGRIDSIPQTERDILAPATIVCIGAWSVLRSSSCKAGCFYSAFRTQHSTSLTLWYTSRAKTSMFTGRRLIARKHDCRGNAVPIV